MTPLVVALNIVLSIAVTTGIFGLLCWSIATQSQDRAAAQTRRRLQLVESPRFAELGISERTATA